MTIQRINVGKRLSEAVVHGNTVYLAGEVPEDTSLDITGQTEQVLMKIEKLLKQVGSDKAKLLSVFDVTKDAEPMRFGAPPKDPVPAGPAPVDPLALTTNAPE